MITFISFHKDKILDANTQNNDNNRATKKDKISIC